MAESSVLLVIGSGPGIGVSVASVFAKNKFSKIALLARNSDRLNSDKATVLKAVGDKASSREIATFSVDISDDVALKKTLAEVEKLGSLEFVLFNAARVAPTKLLETPVSEIELDFKVTNIALYTTFQWAFPLLQKTGTSLPATSPSFFVTNSILYKEPVADVFSLTLTKTAQRSLVLMLNETFGKEVHVALLSVGGPVSPDNRVINPTNIANGAWGLFDQPKAKWEVEVEFLEK